MNVAKHNKKRRRIPDRLDATKLVGPPVLVEYKPAETWKERHARRLRTALEHDAPVREFCERHNIEIKIHNNGHHWMFYLHGKDAGKWGNLIEWWPSSAKLCIGKSFKNKTIHTHDYVQTLRIICKAWGLDDAVLSAPAEEE